MATLSRRRAAMAVLLVFSAIARAQAPARPLAEPRFPVPPQLVLPDLFAAVQEARVFADGKAFADAVPNETPRAILGDYRRLGRPTEAGELRKFVAAHFTVPAEIKPAAASPEHLSLRDHIDQLWGPLTRSTPTAPPYSSLLPLPHPYVVPGGRFREIYYWDSYFTMLGLVDSGRTDLLTDMVRDFAYLIDTYGHVPNGTRSYYLSRSQPPLFFEMVALLDAADPAAAYAQYLPQLRREYAFWMEGERSQRHGIAHRRVVALPDGSVLNRYYDDVDTPRDESYREDQELARSSGRESHQLFRDIRAAAESGWDFSSRWFADGRTLATVVTTEIVPVDLNSLLFGLENAIASGCRRQGDASCVRNFTRRAAARHAAIDRYLWDPERGTYVDYRWTQRAQIARLSAATLYPLFVGAASPDQARAVAAATERTLLQPGGIVTTPLATGQQWDSPNGWAPLQWIAIDGLRHNQQPRLAAAIACRWMVGVNRLYANSGKLVEKYDVVANGKTGGGGEYPTQDGFGWTNGVMRRLMGLYPAQAMRVSADDCPAPN